MNFIKLIRAYTLVGILAMACAVSAQPKAGKNIPQNVVTTFNAKYPQAQVNRWKKEKTGYTVKFRLNKQTYNAAFDSLGKWTETVSKIKWPWHLPEAVKKECQKSPHGLWHTYEVFNVENPSGKFYRIMVDNSNHPIDAEHQMVLAENWEINIKPDGILAYEKNITDAPFKF